MQNKFSEEDALRLQKLMARIVKDAEFKLSLNEFVELFNDFDWVNKTLIPKIKDNIFQVEKLIQPKPEAKARSSKTK